MKYKLLIILSFSCLFAFSQETDSEPKTKKLEFGIGVWTNIGMRIEIDSQDFVSIENDPKWTKTTKGSKASYGIPVTIRLKNALGIISGLNYTYNQVTYYYRYSLDNSQSYFVPGFDEINNTYTAKFIDIPLHLTLRKREPLGLYFEAGPTFSFPVSIKNSLDYTKKTDLIKVTENRDASVKAFPMAFSFETKGGIAYRYKNFDVFARVIVCFSGNYMENTVKDDYLKEFKTFGAYVSGSFEVGIMYIL